LDEVKNALKFCYSLSAFDMIFEDQTGGLLTHQRHFDEKKWQLKVHP
jgi:hypothetical protein